MSRFSAIVDRLRLQRIEVTKAKSRKMKARKKKEYPKMTFHSKELERIFNAMPEDCKDLIRKGR